MPGHLMRYAFLMLLCVVSLSAQSSRAARSGMGGGIEPGPYNPFAGGEYFEGEKRTMLFDVTKVGAIGRLETREKFDFIWREFLRNHSIDVRGCFTPDAKASSPDNLFTQNAFQDYVSRHSPSLFINETEVCAKCGPDGKVPTVVELQIVRQNCRVCDGVKTMKYRTEYRLVWPGVHAPKMQLSDELRDAIGFNGELPPSAAYKEQKLERSRIEAKPSATFGVSDISVSKSKGKIDFVIGFAGKPAAPVQKVGYEMTFYSEPEGRGQILATSGSRVAEVTGTRLTFAQLQYPGVVAESYRLTSDYYAEALARLAGAKSVVVMVSDASGSALQFSSAEKTPKVFAIRSPDELGSSGPSQVAPGTPKTRRTSYGSGLVFTADGHVFTNHHVIDESEKISIVVFSNGQLTKKYSATIVSKDTKIDLAILKVDGWAPPKGSFPTPPRVVSSVNCKLGDPVFVLGFPLPSTLSSNVKYTKGDISDTAGIDDDSTKIQHTADIQPGNSGGPMALLDGRVVGVVVSSLSPVFTLRRSGVIPQGVNFSVKTDYLLTMAKVAGVEVPDYPLSPSPVDHVKSYTVQIMCE